MDRHEFLRDLHRLLSPRTYLEIGVDRGRSLQHSRVPSIGIDPAFTVVHEIQCDLHLARTSSDEFFARPAPLAHFAQPVIDLAFIDGMHLAEYALRDYLSIERFTHPTTVVLIDDVLPRTVEEANRDRTTTDWAGDVYKAVTALRELRSDLVVIEVDTEPTGVAVVLCPEATRGGVLPTYDEWLADAVSPDPQDVPRHVLDRSRAVSPQGLLAAPWWNQLARWRRLSPAGAAERVRNAVSSTFGANASPPVI